MIRPVIGILSRVQDEKNDITYASGDCIKAVYMAGGMPVIIPLILDEDVIKSQISLIDGLLVPGGVDVNSLLYDEEPIKEQGMVIEELDEFDIKSIKVAREMGKPILGICRGCQAINVSFDGTLFQDLSQVKTHFICHVQKSKSSFGSHTININDDSILNDIIGSQAVVNSLHHQAVKHVAPGFKVTAYSLDGIVEAIESLDGLVIGVQWHPESMVSKHENMLKLFQHFIDKCRK